MDDMNDPTAEDARAHVKAMLNILEDFGEEKVRLHSTQKAILNFLEDSSAERTHLQATQRAIINILDDFSAEKARLSELQRAIMNVLEDFGAEKIRLEETKKALLNILDDFEVEKDRVKRAEERFRSLLEFAPDAMVIVGSDGKIVFVNAQAEKLFRYTLAELTGEPVEKLIPQRFTGRHPAHRTGYFKQPTARPMGVGLELFGLRKDGSEFPVEISLSPLDTDEGILVLSAIRDVTERKQVEEARARATAELARSNAELEQFAYVASHDLQEPLRMVSAYVQLLEKRYKSQLDSQADKYIHYAVDGAKRMESLIAALLDYSRAGRLELQLAPVDAEAVLDGVLGNLRSVLQESRGEVTHDSLPAVFSDASQLARVLQNLVGNALKFHRGGEVPRVHVSAQHVENNWVFSVRDNGIGIEAAYADRVFVIFQRLHTRAEYPGTGIGLAICKKVVERLGGRIWFESEIGKGTTFFFTLPDNVPARRGSATKEHGT